MIGDENERRAKILAETLKQVAILPHSASGCQIFEQVRKAIGEPEEECGLEINAALFLLIRSGILQSNTYDPIKKTAITCRDMTVQGSPALTQYIWADPIVEGYGEVEET